ncbi:radical SAM protein [Bradyrhizobium sp. HKCCYLRH3095]|uniref:radical SAM protein n=1 Tax=Bradyrhizobium sp. HKCCYLRH3095 TaxID=3420765 RepID=UPI003EBF96B3
MLDYRLAMAGRNGYLRQLIYRPHTSELIWEDNGERIELSAVGMSYDPAPPEWTSAEIVSPEHPGRKSGRVRALKIQLGLKCNYACAYCNQGAQPHERGGNVEDVHAFLRKLPDWFDGGENGDGSGVRIEFWGGEPLVYWKQLRVLGGALRSAYPRAKFNIITNGSLLDDEKIEWLDTLGFGVGISHDGPAMRYRGPDPLDDPRSRDAIRRLYDRLKPWGRIGFNCVLHKHNTSLVAIREHIAARMALPPGEIPLSTEEILLPYDEGGLGLSPMNDAEHRAYREAIFWEAVRGQSMSVATVRSKMEGFFRSIAQGRPASTLGQKCGMDRSDNIAVDLRGSVLTCQNTSAATRHRIGSIEAFEDIRLDTAHHWSTREECGRCPVLQLCQGACLFLEDRLWRQACDNSFEHNLAVLAAALYWLTRLVLVEIEGPVLRREDLPRRIRVISLPAATAAA